VKYLKSKTVILRFGEKFQTLTYSLGPERGHAPPRARQIYISTSPDFWRSNFI